MKVNILAFGQVAEITGKNSWSFSDVRSTAEFTEKLLGQYPDLKSVQYLIAVNKKIIHGESILQNDDTVALLPPFSGG